MNPERLAEIEARVDAATPGPWGTLHARPDERKMTAIWSGSLASGALAYVGAEWTDAVADAEFIAHARSDVPALLDALRVTEGERDAGAERADRAEAALNQAVRAMCEVERHCPCGARPESPNTHPHVGSCPVGRFLAEHPEPSPEPVCATCNDTQMDMTKPEGDGVHFGPCPVCAQTESNTRSGTMGDSK